MRKEASGRDGWTLQPREQSSCHRPCSTNTKNQASERRGGHRNACANCRARERCTENWALGEEVEDCGGSGAAGAVIPRGRFVNRLGLDLPIHRVSVCLCVARNRVTSMKVVRALVSKWRFGFDDSCQALSS